MEARGDNKLNKLEALLASDSVAFIQALLPGGKWEGDEYVVLNPKRHDASLGSFKINKVKCQFKDFAAGVSGDLVDLYAYVHNLTNAEAIKALLERYGLLEQPKTPTSKTKYLGVPPVSAKRPNFYLKKLGGEPTMVFRYADAELNTLFFVARYEVDGKKETRPWSWCLCTDKDNNQFEGWGLKYPDAPRPLYGLWTLSRSDTVIICEGEKAAQAGLEFLQDYGFIASPAGAESAGEADWSPVYGKKIIIWPDHDPAGMIYARKVCELLKEHCPEISILCVSSFPKKYDIWDVINTDKWDAEKIRAFIKTHAQSVKTDDAQDSEQARPASDRPFLLLGVSESRYWFYANRRIWSICPSQFKSEYMTQIAPKSYWESRYGELNKNGDIVISWQDVADDIQQAALAMPNFNPEKIRKRGTWIDGDNVVTHLGSKLIVNSKETKITEYESKYLYPETRDIDLECRTPITAVEAKRLSEFLRTLRWAGKFDFRLAVGWLYLAPVCGALRWRPNIWLFGQAGSGKTWTLNNVFVPVLGKLALNIVQGSTEAGIRQQLSSEALPTIFDEAEPQDKSAQSRLEGILRLMRVSTSAQDGSVLKGSASGEALQFTLRTVFLFASIVPAVHQQADLERITMLELRRNTSPKASEEFQEIQRQRNNLLTHEYCESLIWRSINNVKDTIHNIETFSNVGTEILGDRRKADQIGTLIAGWWSLENDGLVSESEARTICNEMLPVCTAEKDTNSEDNKNYMQCLRRLLTSMIKVEATDRVVERAFSEILAIACKDKDDLVDGVNRSEARKALERSGIRVDDKCIYISNTHKALERIFDGSPWARGWNTVLQHGAFEKHPVPLKFAGFPSRCAKIEIAKYESLISQDEELLF